jgi:FkbM family methyltransferase
MSSLRRLGWYDWKLTEMRSEWDMTQGKLQRMESDLAAAAGRRAELEDRLSKANQQNAILARHQEQQEAALARITDSLLDTELQSEMLARELDQAAARAAVAEAREATLDKALHAQRLTTEALRSVLAETRNGNSILGRFLRQMCNAPPGLPGRFSLGLGASTPKRHPDARDQTRLARENGQGPQVPPAGVPAEQQADPLARAEASPEPEGSLVTVDYPASHDSGLIYDIGAHKGQDTEFYLRKGFRVVAVDANPLQYEALSSRFAAEIERGVLKVLNVGVASERSAEPLEFYINEEISEWSSFVKEIAGRDGHPLKGVRVPVRTLADIVGEYGDPYYVKIDIQGYDHIALKSLIESGRLPRYVSVGNGNGGMLKALVTAGYDRFKYIQQNNVQQSKLPKPAREGRFVEYEFDSGASGPFGEESPGDWLKAEEVRLLIGQVWDPEGYGKNPDHDDGVHGWFDLHAARLRY